MVAIIWMVSSSSLFTPCPASIRRLLERDVVVQGNPRVYKALRDQLAAVLGELRRMEAGGGVDDELLATIRLITVTLDGMRED